MSKAEKLKEGNSNLEIERKFLIDSSPVNLDGYASDSIIQGYVASVDEYLHIRIRKKGDLFFLTFKQGRGKKRLEVEITIRLDQFEALWPLTEGRRIKKTRYYLPWNEHTLELDVYHENLKGLLTVEVEFESEIGVETFEPPPWFGREITDDPHYGNYALAVWGVPG